MAVHEIIDARRSVRSYQPDAAVSEEQVQDLLHAAMLAPSAHNRRQWGFVVVRNRAMLDKLAEGHPYAKSLRTAPMAIIVLARPSEVPADQLYVQQDCTAATMNILLQATAMGLGSCWCGVYPTETLVNMVREAAELPGEEIPFSMIAIGVPVASPQQRGAYDASKVLWK